jgi:hypothetical protein
MHFLQILINLFLFLARWCCIVVRSCDLFDPHTFIKFCHDGNILTILNERELGGINKFSFHCKSHVSWTKFGINFCPVQMFLENNGLDSLREDAILIANVFLSHSTLVILVNQFLCHRWESTIVTRLEVQTVIKEVLLLCYFFIFSRVVILSLLPFIESLRELLGGVPLIFYKFS